MLSSGLRALHLRLVMTGAAFGAAFRLAGRAGRIAMRGGDRRKALAALAGTSEGQRLAFSVLRVARPNLVLRRRLVTAYPNTGTAIVSRAADVAEVLERDQDFAVVYEPKMRAITAGENFFLGMADGPDYTRDATTMRMAVRRSDVPDILVPLVARTVSAALPASGGRIDVASAVAQHAAATIAAAYFGTPGPSAREMVNWTTVIFWYLFVDLAGDAQVERDALQAASACRAYLDGAIAAGHGSPGADTVLARCLEMQAAGLPGLSDLAIRNNLIGLLIGLVPTLAKAGVQALAQLLDRPLALEQARKAARADDDAALGALVLEAFRFDPVNPAIYRRATRATIIARGTMRARRIPEGTMVLASNLSAMFDPLAVEYPTHFSIHRPWRDYMLWGHGMHACFGGHINRAVIPQILKPLLRRDGLRRAAGKAGRIEYAGTPFPVHFFVEFDAATE